jgi:hypothetical protein
MSAGDRIVEVRPSNNVYTALVAIAVVVEIIGFVALFMRHSQLFGKGLFS